MKASVEAYGLKIGVDNSVTEALFDGKFGCRFSFLSDNFDNRYELVLTVDEATELIEKIKKTIESIDKVKREINIRHENT